MVAQAGCNGRDGHNIDQDTFYAELRVDPRTSFGGKSQFGMLSQLAFGFLGQLWVLDKKYSSLHEVSPDGRQKRCLHADSQLRQPCGIAAARTGDELFVCDTDNQRIVEYSQSRLNLVREVPLGPFGLCCPQGLGLSTDNKVLAIADLNHGRVVLVQLDGTRAPWAIPTAGQLSHDATGLWAPSSVAFAGENNELVVVADPYASRVQIFTKEGAFVRSIINHDTTGGIAVDRYGNILTLGFKTLKLYTQDGMLMRERVGMLPKAFRGVWGGLAVDRMTGKIAVSDAKMNRIFSLQRPRPSMLVQLLVAPTENDMVAVTCWGLDGGLLADLVIDLSSTVRDLHVQIQKVLRNWNEHPLAAVLPDGTLLSTCTARTPLAKLFPVDGSSVPANWDLSPNSDKLGCTALHWRFK